MGTNRKRQARGRTSSNGVTEVDYLYFTMGDFFEAENYTDGKTEEELKAFWTKNRKAIMQRYLESNRAWGYKGVRPWSFWQWDMSEPQQKIPPGEHDSQRVWDRKKSKYLWVETDYQYLKRLNLLEEWEHDVT